MPRSDAQKKADKKYITKTYKRYAINTRLECVPKIEKYMSKHNFTSSSSFFNAAYMETYKPPTMKDVKREAITTLKMLVVCIILYIILYFIIK